MIDPIVVMHGQRKEILKLRADRADLLKACKAVLASVVWDEKRDLAELRPDSHVEAIVTLAVAKAEAK